MFKLGQILKNYQPVLSKPPPFARLAHAAVYERASKMSIDLAAAPLLIVGSKQKNVQKSFRIKKFLKFYHKHRHRECFRYAPTLFVCRMNSVLRLKVFRRPAIAIRICPIRAGYIELKRRRCLDVYKKKNTQDLSKFVVFGQNF